MPIENYTTKEPIGKLVTTSKRSAWDDIMSLPYIKDEQHHIMIDGDLHYYKLEKYKDELKQIRAKD